MVLDLSYNQLTGPIPPGIGNLTNLDGLDLRRNQLTGPIPPEIGNLTNLVDLDLTYNWLTGPIPPGIGNLTNLGSRGWGLHLGHNQLTGPIPPGIGNLTNLHTLTLGHNQLTGPIPPGIGNLTNLHTLTLRHNQLTGPIPPELANLTNLHDLDLSYNRLTGPIPPELGNLGNLGNLARVERLDLSRNRLTGPIPPEIMGAFTGGSGLWSLNLSYNRLTGAIPEPAARLVMSKLLSMGLRCNELTGPIPEKLRKVYGTIARDTHTPKLRGNMLTGPAHYELLKPTCFFNDIGGSVHEANINLVAAWGITTGCETEMFCPSKTVNRAQMASFLNAATLELYGRHFDRGLLDVRLSDVADNAWYRGGAHWAVANGVIRAPGGVFDPGGAVTRADMAEMLVAAFAHLSAADRAEGVFTDTAGLTDAAVRAVEGIAAAGVTAGCAAAPRRYCPGETVTRAQMASFLARAVSR